MKCKKCPESAENCVGSEIIMLDGNFIDYFNWDLKNIYNYINRLLERERLI